MMRRMSNRFAALAAAAASTSGGFWASVAIWSSLDEDDVQDHDEREGAHAQEPRRPVPDLLALLHALGLGVLARQPPDEAPQVVLRLRLRDERDDDRDDGVGDERDDGAPEARGQLRAEG